MNHKIRQGGSREKQKRFHSSVTSSSISTAKQLRYLPFTCMQWDRLFLWDFKVVVIPNLTLTNLEWFTFGIDKILALLFLSTFLREKYYFSSRYPQVGMWLLTATVLDITKTLKQNSMTSTSKQGVGFKWYSCFLYLVPHAPSHWHARAARERKACPAAARGMALTLLPLSSDQLSVPLCGMKINLQVKNIFLRLAGLFYFFFFFNL